MKPIPSLVFIQIFIYFLSVLPLMSSIKWKNNKLYIKSTNNYKDCVICLGLLFCIFATYDGDWYHYSEIFTLDPRNIDNLYSIEPSHKWIIKNLSLGSYIFWRVIIWGSIFIFYYLSLKRLDENNLITWCCFTCMTMLQISTGRVYLGIAILFYGFCCILIPKKGLYSILKGLIIMFISLIFHKSIFIYLTATGAALLFNNRKLLMLSLICFPFALKIFITLLSYYLLGLEAANSATNYLQKDTLDTGIGNMLYSIPVKVTIVLIIAFYYFYLLKAHPFSENLKTQRKLWQYCYNILYLYFIIYFALTFNGIGAASISNRVLIGLYFPIPILMSRLIQTKYKNKFIISIWVICYIIGTYRLFYAWYLQRIGAGV